MPFKSEAQRRYLWANEPEIARDWTDTYGSRIQKSNGGIMSMQGGVKNYLGEQPMVSAPKYWQSAPDHEMTELAYITPRERDVLVNMDMYGSMNGSPNEGPSGIMSLNGWGDKDQGFGSPGGGTANTGGHGYGDQERSYTRSTDAGRGTETVTVSPKDHFEQSWSGQPGFLGLGGGYRNLKTPGVTPERGGAYQSRLNPMGVMSLLGGFMKKPFTLAATGFNAVRNKFGPAWNDWTDSKYFNEFLNKRKAAQYEDAIATDNSYDPNARIQDTSFEQDYNVPYYLDEFQPEGLDTTNLYDEFPTEEIVATGTNYPGENRYQEPQSSWLKNFKNAPWTST
jgi:hypothetical protein